MDRREFLALSASMGLVVQQQTRVTLLTTDYRVDYLRRVRP